MAEFYPDTEITATSITGSPSYLQNNDTSSWYTADSASADIELHVGMQNPSKDLDGEQTVEVHVRLAQAGAGVGPVDFTVSVYEAGTEIVSGVITGSTSSTSGETFTGTWMVDGPNSVNPSDIEYVVSATGVNNSGNKDTLDVGYLTWTAGYYEYLTVTVDESLSSTNYRDATVGANVDFTGYSDVDVWFELRESGTSTWGFSSTPKTVTNPTTVTATVEGLTPGTQYEYRAHAAAVNADASDTDPSDTYPTVTTDTRDLAVTMDSPDDVWSMAARLTGELTEFGGFESDAELWFEYGRASEGLINETTHRTVASPQTIEELISGLDEATDYVARLAASAGDQSTTSETKTFTTPLRLTGMVDVEGQRMEGVPVTILSRWPVTTLYDEGDGADNWVRGYTKYTGTVNSESTYYRISAGEASASDDTAVVTDAVYDLTDFEMVEIEWENVGDNSTSQSSHLIVSTEKGGTYTTSDAKTKRTDTFSRLTTTLDVSGLTGEYYIRIHAVDESTSSRKISDIRLYRVRLKPGSESGESVERQLTTHSNGRFVAEVPPGKVYHVVSTYEADDGTQYVGHSKPFINGGDS